MVETWTPLGDWQLPGLALLAKEVADRDTASQLATSYARSTGTQTPPVSEDEVLPVRHHPAHDVRKNELSQH